MKLGRFPCQEEALREAMAAKTAGNGESGFSRRVWFALIGTALGSGAVGYLVGSGGALAVRAESESELDYRRVWARKMASEETPLRELLANADAFVLELVSRSYRDPLVWAGVERICVALYDNSEVLQGEVRSRVSGYIATTIRITQPPEELALKRFLPTLDRLAKY